jgi:hypothetical protein
MYQLNQPIETDNRYTILTNLSETIICLTNLPEVPEISTSNYMEKKDCGRVMNLPAVRNPKKVGQQPTLNQHILQSKPMDDQNLNYIPTIINGRINLTMKNNKNNSVISKLHYIRNLLKESTVEMLNNKAKYSKCHKHKVLLMGDSHVRGSAAKMTASLDAQFNVCGVVKPGSVAKSLIETVKEVERLTMNDFLSKLYRQE